MEQRNFNPGVHLLLGNSLLAGSGNNWNVTNAIAKVKALKHPEAIRGVLVRVGWDDTTLGLKADGTQDWIPAKIDGLKKMFRDLRTAGLVGSLNLELKGFGGAFKAGEGMVGGHIAPAYARSGFGNARFGTGCQYPYDGKGTFSGGYVLAVQYPQARVEFLRWARALISVLETEAPEACEGMFFTETAVGTPINPETGVKMPLPAAEALAFYQGLVDMQIEMRDHARKFWIGCATNYPISETNGAVPFMTRQMHAEGLVIAPPDIWRRAREAEHLEGPGTTTNQKKVYGHFPEAWGPTPAAPRKTVVAAQIQEGDYETEDHTVGNAADAHHAETGTWTHEGWKLISEQDLLDKARRTDWTPALQQGLGCTHLFIYTKETRQGRHTDPGQLDPWSRWKPILAAEYEEHGPGMGFSALRPTNHDMGLPAMTSTVSAALARLASGETTALFVPGLLLSQRQAAPSMTVAQTIAKARATSDAFCGIEIEIPWRSIENTKNVYNFAAVKDACIKAYEAGLVCRILFTTKYTQAPDYFDVTADFGGEKGYWLAKSGPAGDINLEMHRLYKPQVKARWLAMMDQFAAQIVGSTDVRVRDGFYGLRFQEYHLGNPVTSLAAQNLPANYEHQYVEALDEVLEYYRTVMPTRCCWIMINDSGPETDMIVATALRVGGIGLCGPDNFPLEPHRTAAGGMPNGVRNGYNMQVAHRGKLPTSLSCYTENGGAEYHGGDVLYAQPWFATGRVPQDVPSGTDTDNNGGLGLYNFARDLLQLHNLVIVPTNAAKAFDMWGRFLTFIDSPNFSNANGAGGMNINIPDSIKGTSVAIPAVPTGITIDNRSVAGLRANWTAVAGATGYDVFRAGVKINATPIAAPAVLYQMNGLTSNTGYVVTVRAVNADGASAQSAPVTGYTRPIAATGLVVSEVTHNSVRLTWTATTSPNALTYDLTANGATVANSGAATTFVLTGLTPSTAYTFGVEVKGTASALFSTTGNPTATATTAAIPVPVAPSAPTVSDVTETGLTLTWTAVPNAATYNVYQNDVLAASGIAGLTQAITGLSPNTAYSFKVSAVNASGESPRSAATSATTLYDVPAAPVPAVSAVSYTSATVAWPAASGAVAYEVNGVSQTGLSFAAAALVPATAYSWSVVAVGPSGLRSAAAVVTATTLAVPPLAAPSVAVGAVSTDSVTLVWAPVPNATGYTVDGVPVAPGALSSVRGGLAPRTAYTWAVRATGVAGSVGPAADVTATTASTLAQISADISAVSKAAAAAALAQVDAAVAERAALSIDSTLADVAAADAKVKADAAVTAADAAVAAIAAASATAASESLAAFADMNDTAAAVVEQEATAAMLASQLAAAEAALTGLRASLATKTAAFGIAQGVAGAVGAAWTAAATAAATAARNGIADAAASAGVTVGAVAAIGAGSVPYPALVAAQIAAGEAAVAADAAADAADAAA